MQRDLPDSHDPRLLEEIRRPFTAHTVVLMAAFATPDVLQGHATGEPVARSASRFDMHDVERLITDVHLAPRDH